MHAVLSFLVVGIQFKYPKAAALYSSRHYNKLHFIAIFAISDTA